MRTSLNQKAPNVYEAPAIFQGERNECHPSNHESCSARSVAIVEDAVAETEFCVEVAPHDGLHVNKGVDERCVK